MWTSSSSWVDEEGWMCGKGRVCESRQRAVELCHFDFHSHRINRKCEWLSFPKIHSFLFTETALHHIISHREISQESAFIMSHKNGQFIHLVSLYLPVSMKILSTTETKM